MIAASTAVFGGLATLLAAIGMYGVLAWGVSRRTAELGIRMALGAQRRDVQRLILPQTAGMIGAGTGAGLSVRWSRFGIGSGRRAGGWMPSRRASRVDPMVALRYE